MKTPIGLDCSWVPKGIVLIPEQPLTCGAFIAMQSREGVKLDNANSFHGMAGHLYKALIEVDGRKRWHTVRRQHSFGQPIVYASPIKIILRLHDIQYHQVGVRPL